MSCSGDFMHVDFAIDASRSALHADANYVGLTTAVLPSLPLAPFCSFIVSLLAICFALLCLCMCVCVHEMWWCYLLSLLVVWQARLLLSFS